MSAADKALTTWVQRACEEISAPFGEVVDTREITAMLETLCSARKIALYGVGREGLMMRALTMRLYHLGLDAHPVGDMTTPALGSEDCLVVSAGPGFFATVEALVNVAEANEARVVLLTANLESQLRSRADVSVVLPARTMDDTTDSAAILPMGSTYEGALFLFSEYLVSRLQKTLAVPEEFMRHNHTNLE